MQPNRHLVRLIPEISHNPLREDIMKNPIRRIVPPLAAVALTVGALTACGSEQADFDNSGNDSQQSDTDSDSADKGADSTDDDSDDESDSGSNEAGGSSGSGQPQDRTEAGPLDPEEALHTITYEFQRSDTPGTVTVGLHSLRVVDGVMLLELSFTPDIGDGQTHTLYNMAEGRISPTLNDRENLKQYRVLESGGDAWETNSGPGGRGVLSGQTLGFWAYYAAPEDDIDTISVSVLGSVVQFDDVQIERS